MFDDLIAALDYKQFCDSVYEGKGKIDSGIVYCSTEHIKQFFESHGENNQNYSIVSACCDYGVVKQAEKPVAADFMNGLALVDFSNYDGYSSIILGARCNLDKCKISDEFSVKCYAFTHSTFPKIPSNIKKWFLVNKDINHPVVEFLPIGLYYEGAKEIFQEIKYQELPKKNNLLYLNWTDYTVERIHIKNYFDQFPWATVDRTRRPMK